MFSATLWEPVRTMREPVGTILERVKDVGTFSHSSHIDPTHSQIVHINQVGSHEACLSPVRCPVRSG